MRSSFRDRMSLYLNGKISEEDREILLKELQSGLYDDQVADDFYAMLESPCQDDVSISELDKDQIFNTIISSEEFAVSRVIRRQAQAAKAVAKHTILLPAAICLPGMIRIFNEVLGKRNRVDTAVGFFLAKALGKRTISPPAVVCFLPGIIRVFNDVFGRRELDRVDAAVGFFLGLAMEGRKEGIGD